MSDRYVADRLIEEYLAAYTEANGKDPDFKIRHVNGLITFDYGHAHIVKRQLSRLVEMTINLKRRVP